MPGSNGLSYGRNRHLAAAKILIDAHGEDAWLEAAQRADHALEDNNSDGVKVWKRVIVAIDELQRQKPATGEALN